MSLKFKPGDRVRVAGHPSGSSTPRSPHILDTSSLTYKGYIGEVAVDWDAKVLVGRVTNIAHVITFQGRTVEEAIQRFHKAVDSYVDWCNQNSVPIERPLVGQVEQAFDDVLPYYSIRLDEPREMDEEHGRKVLRYTLEDEDNLEAE